MEGPYCTSQRMRILVVDNSKASSAIYTPLLVSRLRHDLKCEVTECNSRDDVADALCDCGPHTWDAVVLSGSSLNMSQSMRACAISKDLMTLLHFGDIPVLGVCFGMQLMAVAYGGHVERLDTAREGVYAVQVSGGCHPLLPGAGAQCFFNHQDVVTEPPVGFTVDATYGSNGSIASFHNRKLHRYGVQFHPEMGEADVTLGRFLRIARRERISCGWGVRISHAAWARVVLAVPSRGLATVAREERLPLDAVAHAWHQFRTRFGVEAMLV